ncbi:MAG: AbrB/MazE/SpoVT family DNA-binding domain-containing protein [Candidatus Brocadiaceae bacterium]|nr:AbrB/MazE/SpoVT family DNA-binding domain-containing protein [Candidatus Brocadiaceae bacterium]
MPLVKVKNKFQITIPTKVRNEVHIKEGDFLEIIAKGETIVIKPKAVVDRESVGDAINEGIKDYKKGRTTRSFSSVKEFKASLKKK